MGDNVTTHIVSGISGDRRKRRADKGNLIKRCASHARRSSYNVGDERQFAKKSPSPRITLKSAIWRNGVFRITAAVNQGGLVGSMEDIKDRIRRVAVFRGGCWQQTGKEVIGEERAFPGLSAFGWPNGYHQEGFKGSFPPRRET
ncbi:hypothetical protein CDAR_518241 [Caerostris darwini]|uniref:Uncharacterized protein n=1 Tax=Caerostris darwini TaxID=1538125 RepID=A0AAV4RM00_9ARAC|nr:hypothetical protein CDAR_518241 [Caerostris darwini]